MDYQSLIDEVINELYRRINKDVLSNSGKKKVVLIGNTSKEDCNILGNAYEVVPYGTNTSISDVDSIVICNMSIEMLANLALGIGPKPEEAFILNAILQERRIFVIEGGVEYKNYRTNVYNSLYALYEEYEKKIIYFGIRPVAHIMDVLNDDSNIHKSNKSKPIIKEYNSTMKVDLTYKKLLLESDLVKLHTKGLTTVEVSKNCIITPLAADFVRFHNLVIKRE